MPEPEPQRPSTPTTEEEAGLREILAHAPLILFAVDAQGRLCLAEGGLLERPDLPRAEMGESLLERFEGSELGEIADAVALGLRGERLTRLVHLDAVDLEVHYFPWAMPGGEAGTVGLVVDVTARERALRELRESDERLRIISDRASEMITEHGVDSRFLFVSRSFAEALGYEPEELLGRSALDLVHPFDRKAVLNDLEDKIARDLPERARLRLQRRDGSTLWADAVTRSFLAADGTYHTVSITRDVTGERAQEERRERRLALLERASTIAGDLVACPAIDLEARIRDALAETGRVGAADRAVVVLLSETGTPQHHWWSADPEDDEAPDTERLAALAGELMRERHEALHMPTIDPASYLASRGNRSALVFPLRTGEATHGFLGLTRTREARGWDADEIEVLRLLADALARGFGRLEAERAVEDRARLQSRITHLARGLLGVPQEELDGEIRKGLELAAHIVGIGNVLLASWDPQDRRFREVHQHGRDGEGGVPADDLRRHRWLEARIRRGELVALPSRSAFPEAAGETLRSGTRALLVAPIELSPRFMAFLVGWDDRDRTPWSSDQLERFRFVGGLLAGALRRRQTGHAVRESEEQLTQSQKMETVGRLAGHIAHDFNNLLTVIAGNAEVVSQELESPRQREDALAIRRAADRAAQLTRDLLAFSRSRPGSLEVVLLNDVVRGVTALLERTLGDDIQLDLRLRPESGRVVVDADRLRQIIVNLALNGRDAMPKGGHLSLDTRRVRLPARQAERIGVRGPGRYAVLEVRDEGEGMDEAVRERVFEPFFTTKRSGTSVGLGLSIAYSSLKELGGAVEVESRREAGTCVRLYLPAAPSSEELGGA
jgi:PAS domain S-box-containing protein